MHAVQTAEQVGIDLTLIEESLRFTPEERALQHQRALEMALQLEAAFLARAESGGDGGIESTPANTVRR